MDWNEVFSGGVGGIIVFILDALRRCISYKIRRVRLLNNLKHDLKILIKQLTKLEKDLYEFSKQYDSPVGKLLELDDFEFPKLDHTRNGEYSLLRNKELNDKQWEMLTTVENLLSYMNAIYAELKEYQQKYEETTTQSSRKVSSLQDRLVSRAKIKWENLVEYLQDAIKTACELLDSLEADVPSELCPDSKGED
ncbi:MAG: hypothetical protein J7J61_07520 [Candidatus Hydrothermae bacterium]|nr:hypothetical protein [Candidatus Hydrothermae bacterium]